jgi:hypothetical protein
MGKALRQRGAFDVIAPGCAALLDIISPSNGAVAAASSRCASVSRATKETSISCSINIDGTGKADIDTGLGFLDHMLGALAKHGRMDITLHVSHLCHCSSRSPLTDGSFSVQGRSAHR